MRVRTHPGEVLRSEFLEPLGLSARALADAIDVPPNRISEILREHRGMTADTALRLSMYFKTTPEFWMNLQTAHDLSVAAQSTALYILAHDGEAGAWSDLVGGCERVSKEAAAKVARDATGGRYSTVSDRAASKASKALAASILTSKGKRK